MTDNANTVTALKKFTKAELTLMLANYVVKQNPALYAGHYEDAVYFVRHHLGPTRKQLLLSAQTCRILPYSWESFEGTWGC